MKLSGGFAVSDADMSETGGGAIHSNAELRLERVVIENNTASGNGGAILSVGRLTLEDSVIRNNRARAGGGIYLETLPEMQRSALNLRQSVVEGNTASSSGGGIYAQSPWGEATVSIVGCTLSDNRAEVIGGGIYVDGEERIDSTTINSNSAGTSGGGISFGADFDGDGFLDPWLRRSLELVNTTVSSNRANRHGGGVVTSGDVTVGFSTIVGNHGGLSGGGLHVTKHFGFFNPDVVLNHSILAANSANMRGNDLYGVNYPIGLLDLGYYDPEIDFSLIGDNDGTRLDEAQSADARGNLIGSSAGMGSIDPRLGPLDDHGGLTRTHSPLIGSPAINAGDTLSIEQRPTSDQRGHDRVLGGVIDIGAVESEVTFAWHNLRKASDVDNDGQTGPLDALVIIAELTNREYSSATTGLLWLDEAPQLFFDVNRDGAAGPVDALMVIGMLPSNTSVHRDSSARLTHPSAEEEDIGHEFPEAMQYW